MNADVIYTSLRSGSEYRLELFLKCGMLEWLRESFSNNNEQTVCSTACAITQAQRIDANNNELILLMTNMMEVSRYGVQSKN